MSIAIAHAADQRLRHPPAQVSLLAEVDMLDEHDLAVIVFDDVVAAEPIAILIEIVGTLNARVALDAQDRLADLLRLKTLSVVDRKRKNTNSVRFTVDRFCFGRPSRLVSRAFGFCSGVTKVEVPGN